MQEEIDDEVRFCPRYWLAKFFFGVMKDDLVVYMHSYVLHRAYEEHNSRRRVWLCTSSIL